MRLKRRRKVRKLVAGTLAFIACLAMGMTMFFYQSNAVYASENTADPSTAMNYQETYNQGSTQYAGRIWTDKSVGTTADYGGKNFELEDGEDFLVTFSALSSAQTIKSQTASPIDVVFVLDFSASMTWGVDSQKVSNPDGSDSRIKYLVDSLNNTIDTLVNANENNRIGIVTFNRVGQVFMDLTSAKEIKAKNIKNKNYLELVNFSGTNGQDDGQSTVENHINNDSRKTDSKTNIHYGLNEAMQMLMGVEDTTVIIEGKNVQRIPNVVLMSDGAPTTIFSDRGEIDWWENLDNSDDSIGWGDNSNAWSANGMLPMMTASYMKNVVTEHYFNDQMNIYTIGFSTNQQTDEMVELANLVLNPDDNLDQASKSGTAEIRLLAEAWEEYSTGGDPSVHYVTESSRESHNYRLTHPNSNDITTLKYNTEYYPANNSSELDQAFESITNSMVDQGKAPTEVTGGLTNSGYITYTDTIGDYMELKDVKGLVIGDKFFEGNYNKETNSITLDTANDTFINNVYGEQDLRNLQITLSEPEENGRQVLTMKIPASLIPLVHDTIELNNDGTVKTFDEQTMYPMRLVYSVGLQSSIKDDDGNINYSKISPEYLADTIHQDGNGNILFFSNYYDGTKLSLTDDKTAGNAYVEYEPAHDNSYYFLQEDTPIYENGGNGLTQVEAGTFDPTKTYYVPFTYYQKDEMEPVTKYEERLGSVMSEYVISDVDGKVYLKAGSPRLGNIAAFTRDKTSNETNTAITSFAPTFNFRTSGDAQSGSFCVYLGNNGVVKVPSASLIIQKQVTAEQGFTAPTDATFTFEIASQIKKNTKVSGIISTNDKEETTEIDFNENGTATVTLKANQSIELLGMGNADYSIQEINNPTGFTLSNITGADKIEDSIASGDISIGTNESITFTNTYKPEPVVIGKNTEAKIQVQKSLTGRNWQDGDAFTFTLDAYGQETQEAINNKDVIVPDDAKTVTITNESETKADSFGDITFNKQGAYTFIVQETKESITGITYDDAAYLVTISVTDAKGQLTVAESQFVKGKIEEDDFVKDNDQTDVDAITFTNNFTPTQITKTPISLVKTLSGDRTTPLQAGEFTFSMQLTEGDETGITLPETLTATNDAEGNVQFGDLIFTKAGIYEITMKEDIPQDAENNMLNGVTYDSHEVVVTYTVSDENGTLTVESKVEGKTTFENKYSATGSTGDTNLVVNKTLTGREWKKGDAFTFTLEAYDDITKQAVKDKSVVLPENAGALLITYDENDSSATKSAQFGEIQITKEGTYIFEVKEDATNKISGITYDATKKYVILTAEDQSDGTMKVDTSIKTEPALESEDTDLSFTNTYSTTAFTGVPTSFNFSKDLAGRDWTEKDVFNFTLTGLEGAPMPEGSTEQSKTIEVTKDNADSFNFGKITYDKAGKYHYTVSEVIPENTYGITYDDHTAEVEVVVTDNGDGTLSAVAQTQQNTTFTNTYSTTSLDYNAVGALRIQKNMIGKSIDQDEFTFTVTAQDKESSEKAGQEITKVTVPAQELINSDGSYTSITSVFDSMKFDQKDIGKTFTYLIKEVIPDNKPGYTYDQVEHTVTIRVSDNGNGTLSVQTTVDDQVFDQNAVVVFNNRYDASGTLGGQGATKIQTTKTLNGRDMLASEFNFVITNTKDATKTPVSSGTNQSAVNGQAANIEFTPITYTTQQLNADVANGLAIKEQNIYTYNYTVEEMTPPTGVQSVRSSFTIQVQVTDQGDGTLAIEVIYPEGTTALDFVNVYGQNAKASIDMKGTKVLQANSGANLPDITGKYQFTITGSEGAPMPSIATVTNDASGNVDFDLIEYTMENVFGNVEETTEDTQEVDASTRSKTFIYTISESGAVAGVTNDTTVKNVTVTVTDNGDGTLSVVSTPTQGPKFTFVNVYQTTTVTSSPTDGTVSIQKELKGQNLEAGQFTFQMKDTAGNVVSEATNDADGNVAFVPITFDKAGTYQYSISEFNTGVLGMNYDTSVYNAVATVTDQGDGTLKVEWTVTKDQKAVDSIVFKNTYAPISSANVQLGAIKKLEGKELSDGQFTFELKDEEGNVVSKATNNEKGMINFEPIDFDKAGNYSYTISEVNDGQEGIQYDESIYDIVIHVEDDQKGHIVVTTCDITKDGEAQEAIIFTNAYQENEQPGNGGQEDPGQNTDGSDTAAKTGAGLFISLIGSAVSLMGLLLVWRKRA
ncbi:LPXTG cell wall surface protein [Faecalicoccus pleomorphus]|uniref:LPXTG cell wall surface protein n=1 Tax=Faecalicoccus pleomorphus TaxID=1323 RepID=A0A380LJK3_9FIRM|nr:FctA domain-containing protein [Faecalicoccus pleomorphus]SUO03427.1 LPXTG cell wall surface protein [Faecalicoccus pleomorphus]